MQFMKPEEFFPMWSKLTQAQRQRLSDAAVQKVFDAEDIVHGGGRTCQGLFLVQAGQLRAYTVSEGGREVTLYRLFERDICLFSATCMMNSIQFDIIIEAQKETTVWLIPVDVYKSIMEESAPLSNYTSEIMAARFSEVMWLLDQILWKSFDRRLASFLLEESAIEGTDRLTITHEQIGNHMGNAREVVTRMLKYFQGEGFVHLSRGMIEISDERGLAALANG